MSRVMTKEMAIAKATRLNQTMARSFEPESFTFHVWSKNNTHFVPLTTVQANNNSVPFRLADLKWKGSIAR